MVKLTLLFRQPPDQHTFEVGYNRSFALLEKMPGIRRRQACVVLGGPAGKSPYYRILEFYFDDYAALDAALLSAPGREAGSELIQFAGREVELVFADVFKD